jgi:hypothetical protein
MMIEKSIGVFDRLLVKSPHWFNVSQLGPYISYTSIDFYVEWLLWSVVKFCASATMLRFYLL